MGVWGRLGKGVRDEGSGVVGVYGWIEYMDSGGIWGYRVEGWWESRG